MFAQLDLFAPPAEEPKKPELKRGRLTPPAVVVLEERPAEDSPAREDQAVAVKREARLEPFPAPQSLPEALQEQEAAPAPVMEAMADRDK
jgi:hypothetical protein